MTPKQLKIKKVPRDQYATYWKKAQEFLHAMESSLKTGEWNAVGLNAVHCAISACDAVLVYYTEQRSASPDHDAAAYLLASLPKVPDAKPKAEALRRIIQEKHVIEYEDRAFTAHEAAELAKLTERFYRWAKELVGS